MLRTLRLILSMAAVVIGASLFSTVFSTRSAGAQAAPPCNSTATPTTPVVNQPFVAFTSTPIATCTPVTIVRSATPTVTATVPATNTPAPPPPTAVSTNTPVPPAPSATSAGGGVGGRNIIPPSTGSGSTATTGTDTLPLVAGALLVLGGAGSLALAARRRR